MHYGFGERSNNDRTTGTCLPSNECTKNTHYLPSHPRVQYYTGLLKKDQVKYMTTHTSWYASESFSSKLSHPLFLSQPQVLPHFVCLN